MSFKTPTAFLLAALIPIIIAMYLLRLRRSEQVVSSIFLWQRMVRDVEANAPWQRLKRNLLLLLQVLTLVALILALARPFRWIEGSASRVLILVIDTSASMAATDVEPSRLEAAKARARQLVDGLPDNARVTVIAAGDAAQVMIASSQDLRQVHRAIDDLRAGTGGSDMASALALASAIASPGQDMLSADQADGEVVVLSDGRVALPQRLAIKGQVRYLPIGVGDNNQAVNTASLERRPDDAMIAFVQVANYAHETALRRLSLYADGQLFNAYDLELAPGGVHSVIADDLPLETIELEARLSGHDALPLDDRAWAVHDNVAPAVVTLVSEGNLFLETALALLPGLEIRVARPGDWERGGGEEGSIQPSNTSAFERSTLTIFDRHVPVSRTLPLGNLLFVAPPRSTSLFTVTGVIDRPVPRIVDETDPLIAYVDLKDIGVLEALRMAPASTAWARSVMEGEAPGETIPLLLAGETGGRRVAVLAFALGQSDLPLSVAFPLLLANLISWLAPGGIDLPAQVPPGASVTFSVPADADEITVARPDGSSVRLLPKLGLVAFADTGQLGPYRVSWGGQRQASFAVNLFSPQESAIEPVERLPIGDGENAEQTDSGQQARQEWWRWLALASLSLLMAEWLVYQRPALSRLRQRASG